MSQDKILIVDDEADIALILKLQLEDSGYGTVRARDGIEALEKLSRETFDLVLLDIKMPRLDGMRVLEKIRGGHRGEAVVMMTAHGNEDIAVEAIKMGAIDYIAKPFSTEDIVKKVERAILLNRTRQENQRLQEKLEAERKKTEAILQGMADLLVAVDERGGVMTVNRKAEEVLGVNRAAIEGLPVDAVLKGDLPPGELPCLVALRTAAPCLDVAYTIAQNERRIPVLSSATPLFHSDGQLAGAVEIIRDMSRLKALEQDKEDFVSMLSHDLKTPITSIVGSLDLVREGRLGMVNEEQRAFLETAVESCDEMVDMIDTLLDVQKFEAGKMVLAFRQEEPQLLIQKTMTKFRSIARRAGLQLVSTIAGPLPSIPVDRNKFSRLLNNLLANAVKFTHEGGEIELKAEQVHLDGERIPARFYPGQTLPESGGFLRISIRDSGIGIPDGALVTIFDRYVQAKNRRLNKAQGTGLGLAFCRKVMDAHRGYIWAESKEGKGSTFFLLFPVAPPE
ncbi:MAG TPA: response regulator [Geobacteraceae bacterium]